MIDQEKSEYRRISVYVGTEEEGRKIQYLIKKYKELARRMHIDYETIEKIMDYRPEEHEVAATTANKILDEVRLRTINIEPPVYKEPQSWMTREQKYATFVKKFPQVPAELLMELVDSWVSDEEKKILNLDLFQLLEYKNNIMKKSKFHDLRLFDVLQLKGKESNEVHAAECF